jgi:hypothetical protein
MALALLFLLPACSDDAPSDTTDSTESGDGDGDPTGDGDGDGAPTGDGDGAPTGDGDPCTPHVWSEADFATVYDVGPGQTYEDPSAVPWESLTAGSLVRIHWRAEPYRDKWVINSVGTEAMPIVVTGVPEDGQLPVISGDGAKTRPELSYWNEPRGLIKIGGADQPAGDDAAWIYIENLDLRDASSANDFTDAGGSNTAYADNAAALYVEWGSHLSFRGNEVSGSGNGIFTGSQSSDVQVQCNYVHDNGVPDSIYEHNSYTESERITFEFNHYGPPCPTCPGNNLKDRSAGTVIRYNWIEAGNRQLDLVESDHDELVALPEYGETWVYGNILVEPDGAGNSQILHYGGDGGDESYYRKGTLHLYANTVVSTRNGNTTWMRLSTNEESCDARDNVVYVIAGGSTLAMTGGTGQLELRNNWLVEGWVDSHDPLTGSVVDGGGNVVGSDPGFADFDNQAFGPAPGSPLVGGAGPLADGAPPPAWMYVKHQAGAVRSAILDIGAYQAD